jgi:pyruvate dehydrogenase (quinone)/pyruvate oxidase
MAKTAADILVETMIDWGIDTIFGIPGDGINGIVEALRKQREKIRFIQVRHEEAAAFMACAWAKFTGRLGACIATSGPGGIHLLNGLYDAKLDGQPVLAVTGLQFHDLIGTSTQQDVALDRLFMDVAVYNERVMGAAHMQNVAVQACRTALAKRGVAHITMPVDLQDQTLKDDERSPRNRPDHISNAYAQSVRLPPQADLAAAAEILNAGKKVTILAGQGALGAGAALTQVAEKLAAPIVKALLGKACVPDDSPYTTGGIGLLGTEPSIDAMENCDTLLVVGSGFPYIEFYPKPGKARCVQIDLNPSRIALRYPVDVGLVGDSRGTLEALLPLLQRNEDRGFLEQAQSGMAKWRDLMSTRATDLTMPMKPQVVAHELGQRIPANAIVTTDSGTITSWWARHIPAKEGQMYSCSGNLATMGCGLPYAVSAQTAHPDRPVFAFVGDGGLTMMMGELATCVKYKLPVRIIVIKNDSLAQIRWEQMVFLGNPEYVCDLQPIDFAGVARSFGMASFVIEDPRRCGSILDQALAIDGPVLIEAVVDANTPPMPAKIKAEQALHLAEALAKGTKDAGEIVKDIAGSKIRELV